MELYTAIRSDTARKYVHDALDEVLKCIQDYGLNAVCLSFNGGKDCTVLLHLLRAAIASLGDGHTIAGIPIVYFKNEEEFDELHAFNEHMIKTYQLKVMEYGPAPMRSCLEALIQDHPELKAIFMGQRRTDPGGVRLRPIEKCDPGWPQIDRLNTILDWTYNQVWDFLMHFNLPYCRLYELGYTSLGPRLLTTPNPRLYKATIASAGYSQPYAPYTLETLKAFLACTKQDGAGCDETKSASQTPTSSASTPTAATTASSRLVSKPYAPCIPDVSGMPHCSIDAVTRDASTSGAQHQDGAAPVSHKCASLSKPIHPDSLYHYMCQYYHVFNSGLASSASSTPVPKVIPHDKPNEMYNTNAIEEGCVGLITYSRPVYLRNWPFYPAFVLTDDSAERLGRLVLPK